MVVYILWEPTVAPQQTIANHVTTQIYLITYTQCHNTVRQSGTTKGKFEIRIYTSNCNRVFVLLNNARLTASFQCRRLLNTWQQRQRQQQQQRRRRQQQPALQVVNHVHTARHVHGQTLPNNKHLLNCSSQNVPTKLASWTVLNVMCEISGYDNYDCKDCSLPGRDAVTFGANCSAEHSGSIFRADDRQSTLLRSGVVFAWNCTASLSTRVQ